MHLKSFALQGIKCFDDARFEFPQREDGSYGGWNVLLGANATGKSTALQAMAVALVGPAAWAPLLTPLGWVRSDPKRVLGHLIATITKGDRDVADRNLQGPFTAKITVTPDVPVEIGKQSYDSPQFVLGGADRSALQKSAYATKKAGWFAAGYGPFRRLSGGSSEAIESLSLPRQHRMASLFREAVALTQCEPWLASLRDRANDGDDPEQKRHLATYEAVRRVVDALLPDGVKIADVKARRVRFVTAGGRDIALADLSDGYRSFLALALDVLRHLVEAHGGDLAKLVSPRGARVTVEGVVLIDEVDAHLHPRWQRRIGTLLPAVFPNVQFIVSSHSPFVAQAANPGGLFVLRPAGEGDAIKVVKPVETVRGWRADAILTSELFGLGDTVDEETEKLLARYRTLGRKRDFETLKPTERRELESLETRLADTLSAPGESHEEHARREATERYIRDTLAKLHEAG